MPKLTEEQIKKALEMGVSQEQIDSFISKGKVETRRKAPFPAKVGEVSKEPFRLLGNLPSSAFNFVRDFITGIAKTPGVVLKKIPEEFKGLVKETGGVGEALKAAAKELPGAVATTLIPESARELFKGNTERAEQLIVEDPVREIMPWVILGRMSAAAKGKTAQFDAAIRETARPVINTAKIPAGVVVKTVGRGLSSAGGVLTGTGRIPLEEAFKAGRETGSIGLFKETPFSQALRGRKEPLAIIREATDAVEILKNKRGDAYRTKLEKIAAEQKKSLDISDLFKKRDEMMKKFNIKIDADGKLDFSRSPIGRPNAVKDVKGVIELLRDWGKRKGDRTPIALDILKRKLDDFYSDSSQARAFVVEIKSTLRNILEKEVKGYKEMTSQYQKMSDLLDEMKNGLSLGGRAGADTILRRLSSAMRQDNELRNYLLNQLENLSGIELTQQISGLALSELTAKGLVGRNLQIGVGFSVFAGLLTPKVLISLIFTSPRVVGEFLQALGATTTQVERFLNALNELRPILNPNKKK